MDKNKSPLKVALHGMDERSRKMMTMYFKGPCKGIAVVVNDKDAEIDMFDADGMNPGILMNERLAKKTHKPIIVLSLHDHKQTSVLAGTLIVSTTDKSGVITHVNKYFIEMSAYTEDELINAPHSILRPGHAAGSF